MAFLGSPAIAVPALDALVEAGLEVVLVVSGVDKRRGRGRETSPTPVKKRAIELGLPVSAEVDDLLLLDLDLAVVVAFGQLLRRPVLEHVAMVNIHFSDLPRWRGAAPVERAILAGDTSSAVCIIDVAEGLDEGDVFGCSEFPIAPTSTLGSLWEEMSHVGAELLVETIDAGLWQRQPQQGEVTYAHKLGVQDREIDWSQTAEEVLRVVRVGGAWTTFSGQRFKIHEAAAASVSLPVGEIDGLLVGTGSGGVELIVVQPAGKPRLDASAWVHGAQPDGVKFESSEKHSDG